MVRILLVLTTVVAAPVSAAAPASDVVAVHALAAAAAATYVVSGGVKGQAVAVAADRPIVANPAPAQNQAASLWEKRMVHGCIRREMRVVC